eukprot:Skav209329  [mRNA]  locus=scaffold724:432056:432322:- [translate_table: standard]
MVLGSTPMSARNSLFAAILMASNVVATMVAAVAMVIAADTGANPSPVSKKALAAATHAVEGQTMPCGQEGCGVVLAITDDDCVKQNTC